MYFHFVIYGSVLLRDSWFLEDLFSIEMLLRSAVTDARIFRLWRKGIRPRASDEARLLRAFYVIKFY